MREPAYDGGSLCAEWKNGERNKYADRCFSRHLAQGIRRSKISVLALALQGQVNLREVISLL